jgi:hypothetical protein
MRKISQVMKSLTAIVGMNVIIGVASIYALAGASEKRVPVAHWWTVCLLRLASRDQFCWRLISHPPSIRTETCREDRTQTFGSEMVKFFRIVECE